MIVRGPILLSPAAIGFGDFLPRGLDLARLGGVVVGPLSADGRGYGGPTSLVELDGGLLASKSTFSRSARRAVERYGASWTRLGCPVIAQLVDAMPDDLGRSARRIVQSPVVVAVEWLPPHAVSPAQVGEGVRALQQSIETPIWVKLPLDNVVSLAERAVTAGAVGVVVGQPLQGAVVQTDRITGAATWLTGDLYGPSAFALMLRALIEVASVQLGCALIACGGIYSAQHVHQALAAGAHAVQLDAMLWTEPGLVRRMVETGE
ncbi:MAG: hypothetical protein R6W76_08145 [Caldilinea sp.]